MWTAKEYDRMRRRTEAFIGAGAPDHEAAHLAWQMLERDKPDSGDNRRVCLECRNLKGERCQLGYSPLRFQLQRCDGFELKGA